MLRLAARVDYKVLVPSFEALVVRTERGGRALTKMKKKSSWLSIRLGCAPGGMHKRYADLQETDIAAACGNSQIATGIVTDERLGQSLMAENTSGEGRCPVVPLVFKTSLGVVRSPEGSTPSLLRHKNTDN